MSWVFNFQSNVPNFLLFRYLVGLFISRQSLWFDTRACDLKPSLCGVQHLQLTGKYSFFSYESPWFARRACCLKVSDACPWSAFFVFLLLQVRTLWTFKIYNLSHVLLFYVQSHVWATFYYNLSHVLSIIQDSFNIYWFIQYILIPQLI